MAVAEIAKHGGNRAAFKYMFLDFGRLNTKGHRQGTKETILSAKFVLIFKYPFKNSAISACFLLVYQQLLSVRHPGCAIYRWSGSDQYGHIFSLDWRLKHSCIIGSKYCKINKAIAQFTYG